MELMEADVKAADLVLWVGISFQQSASTVYFRKVRCWIQVRGAGWKQRKTGCSSPHYIANREARPQGRRPASAAIAMAGPHAHQPGLGIESLTILPLGLARVHNHFLPGFAACRRRAGWARRCRR